MGNTPSCPRKGVDISVIDLDSEEEENKSAIPPTTPNAGDTMDPTTPTVFREGSSSIIKPVDGCFPRISRQDNFRSHQTCVDSDVGVFLPSKNSTITPQSRPILASKGPIFGASQALKNFSDFAREESNQVVSQKSSGGETQMLDPTTQTRSPPEVFLEPDSQGENVVEMRDTDKRPNAGRCAELVQGLQELKSQWKTESGIMSDDIKKLKQALEKANGEIELLKETSKNTNATADEIRTNIKRICDETIYKVHQSHNYCPHGKLIPEHVIQKIGSNVTRPVFERRGIRRCDRQRKPMSPLVLHRNLRYDCENKAIIFPRFVCARDSYIRDRRTGAGPNREATSAAGCHQRTSTTVGSKK